MLDYAGETRVKMFQLIRTGFDSKLAFVLAKLWKGNVESSAWIQDVQLSFYISSLRYSFFESDILNSQQETVQDIINAVRNEFILDISYSNQLLKELYSRQMKADKFNLDEKVRFVNLLVEQNPIFYKFDIFYNLV